MTTLRASPARKRTDDVLTMSMTIGRKLSIRLRYKSSPSVLAAGWPSGSMVGSKSAEATNKERYSKPVIRRNPARSYTSEEISRHAAAGNERATALLEEFESSDQRILKPWRTVPLLR